MVFHETSQGHNFQYWESINCMALSCGFPKTGVPQNGWFIIIMENPRIPLKRMIWGYPHFRKPPHIQKVSECILATFCSEIIWVATESLVNVVNVAVSSFGCSTHSAAATSMITILVVR